MTWHTLQQLIRILLYAGGSAYFGTEIADGEAFQAAIGGVIAALAFVWWVLKERGAVS